MEKRFSDKSLLKIALALGILGVGVLIVLSLLMPEIEMLDYYNAEGKVRLEGDLISSDNRGNYTFMKIRYDCVVDAMVFDSLEFNDSSYINGSRIIVEGNIQEYRGRKSIAADKIEFPVRTGEYG